MKIIIVKEVLTVEGLKLHRYWISESHFSINPNFFNKIGTTSKISPEMQHIIKKIDDNNAEVEITVHIRRDENSPFEVKLSINGFFECKNWEKDSEQNKLLLFTSTQILFPYLRQAVSTITGLANIPSYVMPLINVYSMFGVNPETKMDGK